jgi:hypothetical protein
MIESDDNKYRVKRSYDRFINREDLSRLSTLREDSQEDNQERIISPNQYDISEYDIIESIEGIFISIFFYNSSIREHVS